MKIWITGMAGFLGGYLYEELSAQGHEVYGNDNLLCSSYDFITGGLAVHGAQSHFHLYKDCCDQRVMYDCLTTQTELSRDKPYDVLIHCAATAHEGLSNFSPSFITKNIYEASVSTFSAAIAAGVKRIIFMSSMARYGNAPLPFKEDSTPPMPIDPYGIAKVAAEDTLKALCQLHNVEYVIAVPHNIIGPRQRYNDPYRNVASIMINRALQGKPILVYGDGQQKRCFSPIQDCLQSLVKMIDAPIAGETINIGPDGGEVTIIDLARMISELVCVHSNGHVVIEKIKQRPNEVKEAWCSSNKARLILGFEPTTSLRDCLEQMVLHIKQQNEVIGVQEFAYNFPIEIEKGCPATWKDKLI